MLVPVVRSRVTSVTEERAFPERVEGGGGDREEAPLTSGNPVGVNLNNEYRQGGETQGLTKTEIRQSERP